MSESRPDRPARIAVYGAGGAPFHHLALLARAGHHVAAVFPADIAAGALAGFDAFVMPGGGYRAMVGQLEPLGIEGARAIRAYVESGGMYIGCCAGSYDAAKVDERFVAMCPPQGEMCLLEATVFNDGGEEWGLRSPGVGVLRAQTVAPAHPVMAGMPETFEIAHYNGPLFEGAEPLARVVGRTERFTAWEEMLGAQPARALIDDAVAAGAANVVAGPCGAGRVVLFGSHPEFGFSIAMEDEQAPARMLRNAIEWQLAENSEPRPAVELVVDAATEADPARVAALAEQLAEGTGALRERGTRAAWLAPEHAMSFFGLAPVEIWTRALDAIDRLAGEAARSAPGTDPRVLGFRPAWEFDGGYHGAVPLLEQSVELLVRALGTWNFDPGQPTGNPYAHMLDSPYHLVAGSYLAAVGRVGGAALLCGVAQPVAAA